MKAFAKYFAGIFLILGITTITAGCGGGGAGGGGTRLIKRAVNIITGSNPDPIVSGSRFAKTVSGHWISIPDHGEAPQDMGQAKFVNPFEKTAGTGTATLQSDGTVLIVNDLAQDTFKLNLTALHEPTDATDPDRGTTESGVGTILIKPEDIRVVGASPFELAADGSVDFVVQAQNGRVAGKRYAIVPVPRNYVPSRAYTNINANFTVAPVSAGTVVKNTSGSYTFKAATGYSGSVQITIQVPDGFTTPFSQVETGNVIAHPAIVITSPTANQTVSGTLPVTFSFANASRVSYAVDSGAETNVTGGFTIDTTTLANADHTITMRGYGKLETAATSVVVKVNNNTATPWPPTNPGPSATGYEYGSPINTNSDGKNLQNSNVFGFTDAAGNYAGAVALSTAGSSRLLDASGAVVYTELSLTTSLRTAGITSDKKLVIPCYNEGGVKVYDIASHNISAYPILDGKPLTHVTTAKVYGNNAVVSGETGVWKFDLSNPSNRTGKFLNATPVRAAGISDQFIYAQRGDNSLFAMDFNGNVHELGTLAAAAYDITIDPNHDVVLIAGRTGSTGAIYRFTKSGAVIGTPIALSGNEQVNGIGTYGNLFTLAPNGAPNAYTLRLK